jgi:N-acyl-phosphatidylethanolamine-hydrolysing phospholipase D
LALYGIATRWALRLGLSDLCTRIAACVLLANLAGCAHGPKEIDAGRLGTVVLGYPKDDASIVRFLLPLAFNAYSQNGTIPSDLSLPKHEVKKRLARLMHSRSGVLWIGHSTFLIRWGGLTILTDPMFSDFVSPLPPMGPRRYKPPALDIAELPPIDVIIISHDHYDHLDEFSLLLLARRFPNAPVLLPSGDEKFAMNAGFRRVRGMTPCQSVILAGLTLTALPADHNSGRTAVDDLHVQALSWSLRSDSRSLFFAGDTSYAPFFRRIRAIFGRQDVVLVPIGAYKPRAEVEEQHADPEEAARIASDLGARIAVGMHWGTFPLSPEPVMEPPRRFLRAESNGVDKRVLPIGDIIIFDGLAALPRSTPSKNGHGREARLLGQQVVIEPKFTP